MTDFIKFSNAIKNSDLKTIQLMIKNGYEIHKEHKFSFINAIGAGDVKVVKILLKNNIKYNLKDAFREAILNGNIDIFKALYFKNRLKTKHAERLLMTASCHGYLDIIKFLSAKKFNIRTESDKALYLSSAFNKMETLKWYLEQGLKLESNHHRAFKASLYGKKDEISQFIIEQFNDQITINKFLMWSAKAGKLDNVKILIAKGGDIKIAKKFGTQPILDHCTKVFFHNLLESIPYAEKNEKLVKI